MLTAPNIIILLNIFLFIVSTVLLIKVFPLRQRAEVRWLIALTSALVIISFFSLNVYMESSLEGKAFFSRLRYIGFSYIGQAWFLFLLLTYSGKTIFRHKWVWILSLLPALGTIIVVLSPGLNTWLVKEYHLMTWQGADLLVFTTGWWFLVHLFTANLFAFIALMFLLFSIPAATGIKRKQMITLLICGSLSLMIDVWAVMSNGPLRWSMLSASTFIITELAILYSIYKQNLFDLAVKTKGTFSQPTSR